MKNHVPEIDGLRAVAVIAVLIFHAFPEFLPGGFIGVDIFFVVSGYVIARTYGARLISKESSLKDFYVRRVRRLAPLYALVLAVTTVFAFLVLEPHLLKAYGTSLFAQPFYAQNFVFWSDSDYFLDPSIKPLLHTWSLAIEEQFYLLFGIGILVARRGKFWLNASVILATVVSLGLGLTGAIEGKTIFFLLPARVWEFTIGIGAWALAARLSRQDARPLELAGALASIAAVVASIVAFDETSPLPGAQSFLACGGTAALLVLFERRPSSAYGFFRTPPALRIGELSYGLYLWHWPALALYSVHVGRALSVLEASVILVLTYMVSEVTYRTVENPIRRRQRIATTPALIRAWVLSSVASIAVGVYLIASSGALHRYSEPVRTLHTAVQSNRIEGRCAYYRSILYPDENFCATGSSPEHDPTRPALLLLGDSHALQLVPIMDDLGAEKEMGVYITEKTCRLGDYGVKKRCPVRLLESIATEAQQKNVQVVVASAFWREEEPDYEAVEASIRPFSDLGIRIVITETVPYNESLDPTVHVASVREGIPRPESFSRDAYESRIRHQRSVIQRLAAEYPETVFPLTPGSELCDDETCFFEVEGFPTHRDDNHLSLPGANLVKPLYRDAIAASLGTP